MLIPMPQDPGDDSDYDPLKIMKKNLRALKGGLGLVESVNSGFGDKTQAPKSDWESKRFGASFPLGNIAMRSDGIQTLVQACGIPAGLISGSSDATSVRESWRIFLFSTIAPLMISVVSELRSKLGVPDLKITHDRLFAIRFTGKIKIVWITH